MTKSLADLVANAPTPREHLAPLCLAPEILDEIEALTAEHDRLLITPSDDEDGPPTRLGGTNNPRAREIKARLAALVEEMRDYEGELRLRATWTDGEWRRWTNAHPARVEGEPGHERDQRVTAGFCNADDLIDTLATFAHDWNGDEIDADAWSKAIEPRISTADKADLAFQVVRLYEGRRDFQLVRSGLSVNLRRLSGSASPATSASPTADSTDASPDSSTGATTETATASL